MVIKREVKLFFEKLLGSTSNLKNLPEMEDLLLQLAERFGVVDMDKWVPEIRHRMKKGDVDGLLQSFHEYFKIHNTIITWTARIQALLALGAIGDTKSITILHEISRHEIGTGTAEGAGIADTILSIISIEAPILLLESQVLLGAVTDADGNVYQAVKLGNQVWTVENFKTTKFDDGTPIPLITDNIEWLALKTPSYCWYNNDIENKLKYGALYNGYAVSDKYTHKNFAPKGWHVSTSSDWDKLNSYLIASGYNWDGTTVFNQTAKSLAAKTDWNEWKYTNIGQIGNDLTKNNTSGFSALPGGYRDGISGAFSVAFGNMGRWWAIEPLHYDQNGYQELFCGSHSLQMGRQNKMGASVRLVKD
jgi:uncharacterized protein (TIGR02145 family)